MATNAAQFSQLSDFSGAGAQYQPYPYNSATYAGDQYPSASLPQGQVQNFIQTPPAPPGGQTANQRRFGQRTVARSGGGRKSRLPPGGRRRAPQVPPGPIVARNGANPVVPLYSYQTLKNNTVVQVPIFWTALNIALGYQVQGDQVIRGLPCIKRLRQLFCTNAGSQYPTDQIESFISENKALTRRMFGMYPPPSPHFAAEVASAPEMEPFETIDFTTESIPFDEGFFVDETLPLDQGFFADESLAALEVNEVPPAPRSRGIDRGRGEISRGGRAEGRSSGRNGRGRNSGSSRNERPTARGTGVEVVVEAPPVGGSTEDPPVGRGTSTRGAGKGRQDVVDIGEFWETGTSGGPGLEEDVVGENFVSVDVDNATAAADAADRRDSSTKSTSSTSFNSTELTGSSSNSNSTVETATETEPPYFDDTGPSGLEDLAYIDSTATDGRQRSGGRRSFDRRRDFVEDRRSFSMRRGFSSTRRKARRRGAPREISRRLTDALSDTGPSAWNARSARARPRPLRHSFPAEPRPPANQVPTPANAKPISVAPAAAVHRAPPTKAGRGGAYVALKVKGCPVLAPSVNRPAKHKLPVTAAPRAPQHPPDQQFPRVKRSADNSTNTVAPSEHSPVAPSETHRGRRQAVPSPPVIDKGSKHLVDSCESKVEIVTPYWAANSAGEIRAIVNTKHFPQAIHQEICKGTTTSRCTGNCLCEQKYTYHRLLSYDPDNNCKGIFIDWFLFPSCCACRCPP